MLSRKLFSIVLFLCGFAALSAHAVIQPLDKKGISDYLLSSNPGVLDVYVLRNGLSPHQVDTVIQSLNQTFEDRLFSGDCKATVEVIKDSYVPHSPINDPSAYGVVQVQVAHSCFPALNKALGALNQNPYIGVKIPRAIHPAVTISN